ncbi:hypothetical protein HXX76_011077 [Chlamydomonas incerta]|uniref:Uncharacterized protein n=1 Tax=Chlamydomonas incerta TaxID=51695 RepID=A0A835SLP3_CHLIN|nr:hypothetical protein HXX76_011077 [Chlamydomonas incerta]|eukprot:KAG2429309.1 hypothetical protein HXX76_011077 [Chlamydomonas incerta]
MLLATHLRSSFPAAASSRSALAARPAVACHRRAMPSVARSPPISQIAPAPLLPASRKPAKRTKVFSSTGAAYEKEKEMEEKQARKIDRDIAAALAEAIDKEARIADLKDRKRRLRAVTGDAIDDTPEMEQLAEQMAALVRLSFNHLQVLVAEGIATNPQRLDSLAFMAEVVTRDPEDLLGLTNTPSGAPSDGSKAAGELAWRRFVDTVHAVLRKQTSLAPLRKVVKDMRVKLFAGTARTRDVDQMPLEELQAVVQSGLLGDFLTQLGVKAVITGEREGEGEEADAAAGERAGSGPQGGSPLSTARWQAVLRLTASGSPTLALEVARSYLPLAPPQHRALALVLKAMSDSKRGGGVDGVLTLKQMHALIKKLDPSIKHLPTNKLSAALLLARLMTDYVLKGKDSDKKGAAAPDK